MYWDFHHPHTSVTHLLSHLVISSHLSYLPQDTWPMQEVGRTLEAPSSSWHSKTISISEVIDFLFLFPFPFLFLSYLHSLIRYCLYLPLSSTYWNTGGSPWEVPFAQLVGENSYETLGKFYTGYGMKMVNSSCLRSFTNIVSIFDRRWKFLA